MSRPPESDILRILCLGDIHSRLTPPRMRKDDYLTNLMVEVREAFAIARERDVDAVVQFGDVFHGVDPPGGCRNETLLAFQEDVDGNPHPFRRLVCGGNHDYANSPDLLWHSALGTLIRAGAVEYTERDDALGITFLHYRDGIEAELEDGILEACPDPIVVAHAAIVSEGYTGQPQIHVNEVPTSPQIRLIACGHIHKPMKLKRADGVWFRNPGSICRTAATEYNLTRVPQVLLIEYTRDGSWMRAEYISLKTSLPPEEIFFSKGKQREKQARTEHTEEFVRNITTLQEFSVAPSSADGGGEDRFASVRRSGEHKQVPEAVLDLAIATWRTECEKRAGIGSTL